MALRTASLAVPFFSMLSLLVACGGSIDSGQSDSPLNGGGGGSSSGNAGGGGGGLGQCSAYPGCDTGDKEVSSPSACLQDDARCYDRTMCGATIWCTGPTAQCDGRPSCERGYTEVKSCPTDSDCKAMTTCGETIHCLRAVAQCTAYPSCAPGDTQVPSSSHCLQDDAVCYPSTLCGTTIWCTGHNADAFPPKPGSSSSGGM